jgi:lipoate-protein ligase A
MTCSAVEGVVDYKTMNNEVLLGALKEMGINDAEATGRNDIHVGGRKVSAQRTN